MQGNEEKSVYPTVHIVGVCPCILLLSGKSKVFGSWAIVVEDRGDEVRTLLAVDT